MAVRKGHPPRRATRLRAAGITGSVVLALSMLGGIGMATAQDEPSQAPGTGPIVPVDPQDWVDMEFKTWDDYVPIRPEEWNDDSNHGSETQFEAAVILLDFEDEPFLIAQEEGAHPFGNPAPPGSPWEGEWEPVDDVRGWFDDYFTTPNEFNGGQTIHSYWMETSHGRTGVSVDTFGPYTLPGKYHEWGLGHGPTGGRSLGDEPDSVCPAGDNCTTFSTQNPDGRNIRRDGNLPWRAEMEAEGLSCPTATNLDVADCGYDFVLYVTAGHDESSTWEEQGRMIFQTHEDVPDAFGPPGAEDGPVLNSAGNPIPNYVGTRYLHAAGLTPEEGGFTSWRAGASQWPNATGGARPSSTQAESSGQSTFAHEISHLFGLPDNYNNPFADNMRTATGYWEMMSRGTFNGPGGTHNRWQVPNQGGSALGPHHMTKYKRDMGFFQPGEIAELQRDDLPDDGIAVATLQARAHQPGADGQLGMRVRFGETTANGQNLRTCEALGHVGDDSFWCHGNDNYHNYEVEVVDTVGNDSFVPGHGVLIAMTRNNNTFPQVWLIDPNPETLDLIDYHRPDGTPVPVLRGDPRQVNNATWHAGTDSDSGFEFVDEHNKLHFYILDTYRDDAGVLLYDVAVRHLDGAGDFGRDVSLGGVDTFAVGDSTGLLRLPLTNNGEAGQDLYSADVYRLSASVDEDGWDVWLPYEVKAVNAGQTAPAYVYAAADDGAAESATVTITATSESDPDATSTFEVELTTTDLKVTFGGAAELVDSYYADGLLERPERQQLLAHLRAAERASGRGAEQALNRFVDLAENIGDTGVYSLASAALVSLADDLRAEL
ncbi:FIMAH domain-containing protein [Phytoactinopolyspora mesophila]|uniref:Peptidase M6 n=1 Tax=Phytoactinopolyspora mesophila TaxID=2650750 RepID=A0A7K3M2S7_9ACTN|nr:immune inhibitor A domain-containing protein [Phytoactinopolyspora mesophila]NDL57569.1 peptidase M6 [Phytoactinopolyspora mesophila]